MIAGIGYHNIKDIRNREGGGRIAVSGIRGRHLDPDRARIILDGPVHHLIERGAEKGLGGGVKMEPTGQGRPVLERGRIGEGIARIRIRKGAGWYVTGQGGIHVDGQLPFRGGHGRRMVGGQYGERHRIRGRQTGGVGGRQADVQCAQGAGIRYGSQGIRPRRHAVKTTGCGIKMQPVGQHSPTAQGRAIMERIAEKRVRIRKMVTRHHKLEIGSLSEGLGDDGTGRVQDGGIVAIGNGQGKGFADRGMAQIRGIGRRHRDGECGLIGCRGHMILSVGGLEGHQIAAAGRSEKGAGVGIKVEPTRQGGGGQGQQVARWTRKSPPGQLKGQGLILRCRLVRDGDPGRWLHGRQHMQSEYICDRGPGLIGGRHLDHQIRLAVRCGAAQGAGVGIKMEPGGGTLRQITPTQEGGRERQMIARIGIAEGISQGQAE